MICCADIYFPHSGVQSLLKYIHDVYVARQQHAAHAAAVGQAKYASAQAVRRDIKVTLNGGKNASTADK